MRSYKYHYTYLITNLTPTNKKQFYIGVKSCDCLPEENSNYMGSSSVLTEDIKLHGLDNFQKIILVEFDSRKEAETHELYMHEKYDVVNDPQYYNKKNGTIGFHVTPESTAKQKETLNDPKWLLTTGNKKIKTLKETVNHPVYKMVNRKIADVKRRKTVNNPAWKETKGAEQQRKYSETVNSEEWKTTAGNGRSRKQAETLNDPDWKATTGKVKIEKQLQTKCDPGWKETVGREANRKHSNTINDPKWKETVGKEQSKKHSNTLNNPAWIKDNTFTCRHCNKSMIGRGMVNRWHGDNCKHKEAI